MYTKLLAQAAEYPQDDWGLVGSTVITGLIIVFLILLILVFLLYGMGRIMKAAEGTSKSPQPVQPKPVPAAPEKNGSVQIAGDSEEIEEDDEEIIAVITAAIAAYSAESGTSYKITKIARREKGRGNWNASGVYDNTRPFPQGR